MRCTAPDRRKSRRSRPPRYPFVLVLPEQGLLAEAVDGGGAVSRIDLDADRAPAAILGGDERGARFGRRVLFPAQWGEVRVRITQIRSYEQNGLKQ